MGVGRWARMLTFAAVLSMIGLFIGNSLGGTRVPFALAEDGMLPKLDGESTHRYGTPWVAIVVVGVIYTIFSLNAFAFLVVADVFLQVLVILGEFAALWKLRFTMPEAATPEGTRGLPGPGAGYPWPNGDYSVGHLQPVHRRRLCTPSAGRWRLWPSASCFTCHSACISNREYRMSIHLRRDQKKNKSKIRVILA